MSVPCRKCGGFVVQQYDAVLRADELVCVNCGCRPVLEIRYPDGRSREDVLLCQKCKIRPRLKYASYRGTEQDSPRCLECALQHRAKRRCYDAKRNPKKGRGNFRQMNTFLFA